VFLSWLPLYWEAKLILLLSLLTPTADTPNLVFEQLLKPLVDLGHATLHERVVPRALHHVIRPVRALAPVALPATLRLMTADELSRWERLLKTAGAAVKTAAGQRGLDLAAIRAATPTSPALTGSHNSPPLSGSSTRSGGGPQAALSVEEVDDVVAPCPTAKGAAPPRIPHTTVAGHDLPGALAVEEGGDSDEEEEEEEDAPLLFVSEGAAPARGGVASGRLSVVRVDDIASVLGRSSAGAGAAGHSNASAGAGVSGSLRRPSRTGRTASGRLDGGVGSGIAPDVRARRPGEGAVVMGGLRTVEERASEGMGRVEEVEL